MLANFKKRYQVKSFIRSWLEYRAIVTQAMQDTVTTPEAEMRFLKLKGRLATQLQVLAESAPPSLAAENHQAYREITAMLSAQRSVTGDESRKEFDEEEFVRTWHEHYIFLNKLLGALRMQREADHRPLPDALPTWMGKKRGRFLFRLGSPVRNLLVAAVLITVVALLGLGLATRWDPGHGHFVAKSDSPVAEAYTAAFNSTYDLWQGVVGLMDPVVTTYGAAWTMTLLILLAASSTFYLILKV